MKLRILLALLLLIFSKCGEIDSCWRIEWKFESEEQIAFDSLFYEIKLKYENKEKLYSGNLTENVYLYRVISISDKTDQEVIEMSPNIECENIARVLHQQIPQKFPESILNPKTNHLENSRDFLL